ncbi:MAG TPA: competence/damage-inducible protein A [Candidatus Methylacidiphilales bacterium]|jgi:nicotinamide-nucleotide amidase|nr:competence/damage-inducible protein A [Candidatus Methylacidiphilales bacterium]
MRVEIINTGTELLLGRVTNTHLAFLAQSLLGLGLRVERQVTVPDGVAIAEAVEAALARTEIIVVTGGLGPTTDDITREAVAETFGRKLVFHREILDDIENKFIKRKLVVTDMQRQQAMVPEGGVVLPNPNGTAPGFIVENDKTVAIVLPGPPRELRPMWNDTVVPWLRKRFADRLPPVHEVTLRLIGTGEAKVQPLIEPDVHAFDPIEVGYCARPGEVDLRLIAPDEARLAKAVALARERLAAHLYAEGAETMEQVVVRLARAARKMVATAESCTGGEVASRITDVPHSSEMFNYGWVTYANLSKMSELGIPATLLETHGAVSAEVAGAMAEGALHRGGADVAVAVTGIAGPTGGTLEKPVGLVYFGLAVKGGKTETHKRNLAVERTTFKTMAAQIALDLVRRALIG